MELTEWESGRVGAVTAHVRPDSGVPVDGLEMLIVILGMVEGMVVAEDDAKGWGGETLEAAWKAP